MSVNRMMFPCLKCSKEFRFHCKLIIHFRTHTGHKPYVCHMCEHASATKGALKKHMTTHTESDREGHCEAPGRVGAPVSKKNVNW